MNWIKEQKFLAGLAAAAVFGTLLLGWLGYGAMSRYEEAKSTFGAMAEEAGRFERLKVYPTKANLESKKIEVQAYAEQTEALQKAFEELRPGELRNISPQEFATRLKAAVDETKATFGENAVLPEEYFLGFEAYKAAPARGQATGILNYQLEVMKGIMLGMADAGISELLNIYRPRLAEEKSEKPKEEKGAVARMLPIELTFRGSEKSVREFLSSLVNHDDHYIVVRSLRISNEKPEPPRAGDAKFDVAEPAAAAQAPVFSAEPAADENFDDLFGGGGADPQPVPDAPIDTSRILSQVLGNEELQVFIRADIYQFLEPKKIP